MADPESVYHATQAYLHRTMPHGTSTLSDDHPTPEGLARAIGFPSFQSMRQAIEKRLAATPEDDYDATVTTILAACADLQDYYLKHSLTSTLNASVAKFISSAYFKINETKETAATSHHSEERTITIKIASQSPTSPEEAKEMDRLTEHLARQTRDELEAMNRTERRLIHTVTLQDVI